MTLPMTYKDKVNEKRKIIENAKRISKLSLLAFGSIDVSDADDFMSDYIVTAKNLMLEILDLSQETEHRLHELMDAPLYEEEPTRDDDFAGHAGPWFGPFGRWDGFCKFFQTLYA